MPDPKDDVATLTRPQLEASLSRLSSWMRGDLRTLGADDRSAAFAREFSRIEVRLATGDHAFFYRTALGLMAEHGMTRPIEESEDT